MRAQIKLDLAPISGITSQKLNHTEQFLRDRGIAFTRIQIDRGRVYFSGLIPAPVYQIREDGYKRLLKKMAKRYDLPDVDFIIVLDDGFDGSILGNHMAPVFCIAKLKSQSYVIAIPETYDYPQWDALYASVQEADSKVAWQDRWEVAFWRGSTTGGLFHLENWQQFLRSRLVLLSKIVPEARLCIYSSCSSNP